MFFRRSRTLFFEMGMVALLLVASKSQAGLTDPRTSWKVYRTTHFRIVHEERHREIARQYGESAERAVALLKPYFSEMPHKTVLVVRDVMDLANGSAGFIPYPMVNVFPVLPEPMSSLDNYARWSDLLALHEMVHILSFQPAHGIYTPLKFIFGHLMTPNGLLPRWYLEGLAVEFETKLTDHGRLRSPQWNAMLRTMVDSRSLATETVDRINESGIPQWPYGQRPYFFGGLLWHEVMEKGGDQIANDLLQNYGRRLPFLIEGPIKKRLGRNYEQLLSDMYEKYRVLAEQQIKRLSEPQAQKFEELKHPGTRQISPRISPNGEVMVYVAARELSGAGELRLVKRIGDDNRFGHEHWRLRMTTSTTRIAWLPDSSGFVFDQLARNRHFYLFRDLYHYDLASKKTTRLTRGERASQPHVSPDGKSVVYVRNLAGGTQLVALELTTMTRQLLYTAALQERISSPNFSDNQSVVFLKRDLSGRERLQKLSLSDLVVRELPTPFHDLSRLERVGSGYLAVAGPDGVNNLYHSDVALTEWKPLTRSITGIFDGEVDGRTNTVIVSQLTDKGARLFSTNLVEEMRKPVPPLITVGKAEPAPFTMVEGTEEEYSPFSYLIPRFWVPFVFSVDGGMLFQGLTFASDPLGYHNLAFNGLYDTLTHRASFGGSYVNSTTPVDIETFFFERNEPLTPDATTILQSRTAGNYNSFFLTETNQFRMTVGAVYNETDGPRSGGLRTFTRAGPSVGLIYSPLADNEPESSAFREVLQLGIFHTHYLGVEDWVGYDRSLLSLNYATNRGLPDLHSASIQVRAVLAPDQPIRGPNSTLGVFGERTIGGNFFASIINSTFVMRGYPSANFIGRKLIVSNLEYQLPLWMLNRGLGTLPVYLNRLDASFFVDAVAVEGSYFSSKGPSVRTNLERSFFSTGVEFRLQTTTAYHMPLTYIVGLFYGFDDKASGGFMPFLGIAISGFEGLNAKAPAYGRHDSHFR